MFANDDKLKNEIKHECELPAQDDVLSMFIKRGYCILLRRRFRRFFLMDISNYKSKLYFKSTSTLNRENIRHLTYYYYTIHPFSTFRSQWCALMAVVFLMQFIVIPMAVVTELIWLQVAESILDYICIADMFVIFNTGYLNQDTNRIVLNKKIIAKNYLRFWFWIDFISTFFDHNFVVKIVTLKGNTDQYLFIISFLKFVRIITMFEYMQQIREAKQQSIYMYKILQVTIVISLMYLVCYCLIDATLNDIIRADSFAMFLGSGQKLIQLMLLFGWEMPNHDLKSLFAEIFVIIIGFILRMYIISELLHIVNKFTYGVYQQHQMVVQLEEYMNYKKLPMSIRRRVQMYFEYGSRQKYYEESKVLQTLSPQLKNELLLHTYLHLLEKVELFSNLPIAIYYNIIYQLKRIIYLPSEVIIACDTYGDCMYFISSGTVAVYAASGKEVCHLADGANFGELAVMVENVKRVATVVAIECCEIYTLQRDDLLLLIQDKPEIYNYLRGILQERYNKFEEKSALNDDNISLNELITHI